VLDRLVNGIPAARVLLVVNYRPEYQHRWANKTHYVQLRLDVLAAESAGSCSMRCSAMIPGWRRSSKSSSTAGIRSSWRRPSGRWWRRRCWRVARAGIG
jgi:hypothetical protein